MMNRESASIYIHFLDNLDPAEFLKLVGMERDTAEVDAEEEFSSDIQLSHTDLQTIVEALDFMACAMEAANFPHGYVDDLMDRIEAVVGEEE